MNSMSSTPFMLSEKVISTATCVRFGIYEKFLYFSLHKSVRTTIQKNDTIDERLARAAWAGDTAALNSLLREKPFILSDSAMINSQENILNTSIKAGQIEISLKIAKSNAQLLTFQDQDGVRPLDVASAYGSLEVVRELLVLGPSEICRLPGRDGKIAIHHAVINGRIDVIEELMEKFPNCIRDSTSFGETALHLAVRYYKFEAVKSLVRWLEILELMEVINWMDKEGNTILHYAASKKQFETIELLVDKNCSTRNVLEVNAPNSNGLTAMDLLNIFIESSSDFHLKELLQQAGGLGSHAVAPTHAPAPHHDQNSPAADNKTPKNWEEIVDYISFDWRKDPPSETRNGLLVVAVLFVAVAFQAGINLPSHISGNQHRLASFLVFNSLILSASMSIIYYLTAGMPFQREFRTASLSLMWAYGSSITATKLPPSVVYPIIVGIPFFMLALRFIPELKRMQWTSN